MLSPASRLHRWSDVRRVQRAITLPFVGVFVGLFLTTASASTRTRAQDTTATVESVPPILQCESGLLHAPAAVLDAQRRTSPVSSDLHASFAQSFVSHVRGTVAVAFRPDVRRTSAVARGYDATAPPFRFV